MVQHLGKEVLLGENDRIISVCGKNFRIFISCQMMIIDFDDCKTARVIKPVIQNLNEQLIYIYIYISLHLIATTHQKVNTSLIPTLQMGNLKVREIVTHLQLVRDRGRIF